MSNCANPNISFEVHFTIPVNADGSDQEYVPGNWYYYQSEPQLATDEYEWFAIKGENTNGNLGNFLSTSYMYVDDIDVTEIDFCDHICQNNAGDVNVPYTIPNGMFGNSGLNFFATFQNANRVEFKVYDKYGCNVYKSNNYDINGLVDPGYNDFAIVWNGNTNTSGFFNCNSNNGNVIYPDVYQITIYAESCGGEDYNYSGSLTVVEIFNPPAVPYNPTQNRTPPDCCPTQWYFQNENWTQSFRKDVDNFITAGSDVLQNPPFPNGPNIVNTGVDVKFFAGNSINLEPGFEVLPGGSFQANIAPCAFFPSGFRVINDGQRDKYEIMRNDVKNLPVIEKNSLISVSPNPTKDVFNLRVQREFLPENSLISIVDMYGKEVYSMKLFNLSADVNIETLASELYILKYISNDKILSMEKIIKQ